MELLKFLLAGLVSFLALPFGAIILSRLNVKGCLAFRVGLSGVLGLGIAGTILGFLFLIPGALSVGGLAVVLVAGLALGVLCLKNKFFAADAECGKSNMAILLLCILLALVPLVGVLTPSTSLDWDSLAYHLALPKIWVQQGHISSVSFIHHSNFPGAVDSWFAVGELLGGQTVAKAFTWWFSTFGAIAIFGFIRDRFSLLSAWVCTIAFLSIPMVMWESGTAYIDVANGLFAGFGFVLAARYIASLEKSDLWLAAISLSLAAGSKYTGLQAIFIASLVALLLLSQTKGSSVKLGALAAAFASPWYIKNFLTVGNPVYPFFYSVLGGKNWDAFQGQIYSEEQKTFGYQGAMNLGQSVLGLVASPGRFTNPLPTAGGGLGFVSLGFAVIAGAVIGVVKGVRDKFDKSLALMILLQLFAWFALSQQSRYILTLVVPMLYFMAQALEWKPLGKFVTGAVALQVVATLWVYNQGFISERFSVLIGGLTRDEFLGGFNLDDGSRVSGKVDIYTASKVFDADASVQKVALFDDVFGYYVNKPYFWATPGHSTELGYATMQTADELIDSLKKLGITHVYLTNLHLRGNPELDIWNRVAGIQGTPIPYTTEERQARMGDQRTKWRVLMAEAIAAKKLVVSTQFSSVRFLFKIQ